MPYREVSRDELTEILSKHAKWLAVDREGTRADLRGADLRGADLRGADLRRANLDSADLYGADLRGADLGDQPILQIGPIGSRSDYLVYKFGLDEAMTGCFRGTLAAFEAAVDATHGGNQWGAQYRAAIALIRATHEVTPRTESLAEPARAQPVEASS